MSSTSFFRLLITVAASLSLLCPALADDDGPSPTPAPTATPTPTPTPLPNGPIRIACGGSSYTDSLGQTWLGDQYFSGGTRITFDSPVFGTNDPTLYQSERYGANFGYHLPLNNGTYVVNLYFAEMYFHDAGDRVFNVTINDQVVLEDFDIYALTGAQNPLERSFLVTIDDGMLDIVGSASVNNAKFSAIEILPAVNPTPTPTATPSSTPTPTATPTPSATPTPTPNPTPSPTATIPPTPTPTIPPTPTPTPISTLRIAISEDGNYHDRDDITSSAMSLAILSATGNAANFVYHGYADHYWLTYTSWEQDMSDSVSGTISRFGGFEATQVYNERVDHAAAVAAMTALINASTASSPLAILEEGPAQTIGEALAASNPSARQYVTIYSHSTWNDTHAQDAGPQEGLSAPRYGYSDFSGMGANTVHIHDQNPNLSVPYSEMTWLRDSSDPRLNWLWQRSQIAGKSTFDCSDAGLTYFVATGDPDGSPDKLKHLLTGQ
ncbi:MAG: malectin [Verrucomicrobia bacterium]|nr:malectin [Verrucomicrobiota bacterium]